MRVSQKHRKHILGEHQLLHLSRAEAMVWQTHSGDSDLTGEPSFDKQAVKSVSSPVRYK
ncbi:hypothetical protein ERICIV_03261 [Paenibacillus larvae subsp. larvae]|uniref:Uncharacterized protein n=1 Tax=Paenibacillus larvae subsp. larvae TaxID=147375 RepID=A0A2L1U3G0_9BACL|nr:hypothetical protein [Paenibacillus larvae]AVF27469.1 hypothetical protein ERICIII_03358 [Paenibacillus larvae subsp. larvae]AVF32132.1 hypothetical protein ERICIV_03261 [Paenibacillus larvae subsp. larvae]MCY7521498.1 hypothetical protein [Paenibacillus larvae]MCY9499126.1 hypothetical protein [Paenibacillus larvae]MCY9510760.1 hypothetical protein [Paenibacillus larvae]